MSAADTTRIALLLSAVALGIAVGDAVLVTVHLERHSRESFTAALPPASTGMLLICERFVDAGRRP